MIGRLNVECQAEGIGKLEVRKVGLDRTRQDVKLWQNLEVRGQLTPDRPEVSHHAQPAQCEVGYQLHVSPQFRIDGPERRLVQASRSSSAGTGGSGPPKFAR